MARWTAREVAERLCKGGAGKSRKCGGSWKVCCPAHGENRPSMSLKDGLKGLIWHCHVGCSQDEVRQAIEEVMGGKMPTDRSSPKPAPAAKEKVALAFLLPPEDVVGRMSINDFWHFAMGEATAIWIYRTAHGAVESVVARYDTEHGKEFLPWHWCRSGSLPAKWTPKAKPENRALYNLDELTRRPNDPVLYCEGEKAADAAAKLFPAWVTVSHPGGSNALEKVDLNPLIGRRVIIMPDADAPGLKMMQTLARLLTGRARVLHELRWPSKRINGMPYELQDGDDAAAHLALGWTREELKQCVEQGHRLIPTLDYVETFGEPRGHGFKLFVNGDEAFLTQPCGDRDLPVHGLRKGWQLVVDAVEGSFNQQLRKHMIVTGRFPRSNGEVLLYEYFALHLLSLFGELDGEASVEKVERWLRWSPYLRKSNGQRILAA